MKAILLESNRLLKSPLGLRPRALLVVAALLLAATWFLPLWDLTMFAPQYGNGLRLHIYSHMLLGGNGGHDVDEINLLNHYIGMHHLSADGFPEFSWLPLAIGAIALLALRAAVFGTVGHHVDVLVTFAGFSGFSLYTFVHKLWVYGHELAPGAPVKVPGFTPPFFGGQQIANFEVYSYPGASSYLLAAAGVALVAGLVCAVRTARRQPAVVRSFDELPQAGAAAR